MSSCSKCGVENPNDARFCRECGGQLVTKIPRAKEYQKAKFGARFGMKKKIIVILTILTAIAVIASVVIFTDRI